MLLSRVRLIRLPPFGEVEISLADAQGNPRSPLVFYGGSGVGKTALLTAIASTRPGHAVLLPAREDAEISSAICDWQLGVDDPKRPHPLRVMTPSLGAAAVALDETEELTALRRREQVLFDRVAKERGFACVSFASTRWFSRQPLTLHSPQRTLLRYDVRAPLTFDDATKSDLTRETKSAIAYAEIVSALTQNTDGTGDVTRSCLGPALKEALNQVLAITAFEYIGIDSTSFEPLFRDAGGHLLAFDHAPKAVRHLSAIVALTLRTLWGAYPGEDPSRGECVALVDELECCLDSSMQTRIVPQLQQALPRVQWIIATGSSSIASSVDEGNVYALRRLPQAERVVVFAGADALLH